MKQCDLTNLLFDYKMLERDSSPDTLAKLKDKLVKINIDINNLDDLRDVLNYMKKFRVDNKKALLESIVNSALSNIFLDEEYSIKIIVDPPTKTRKNTKYYINFYQGEELIGDNTTVQKTNGGGVLTVISFILKIIIGYVNSGQTLFLLDESLAQLSTEYTENASKFIRELCDQYDLTIVLITQNLDIAVNAHMIYNLQGIPTPPTTTLRVKKRVENYEEGHEFKNDYIVKIRHFQSIEKLDINFKGFTAIKAKSNTGKSAIFRAVSSVLYNQFEPKIYPRKQKGPSEKTAVRFESTGTTPFVIKMEYSNDKACYTFDGQTNCGKKGVGEKLNRYLSTKGFSRIDLSHHKSYKSNLRDQSESLAVGNQYDGLFLINGSNSDLDKIFNIIFDSEAISHAMKSIDYDKRDMEAARAILEREYKKAQGRFEKAEKDLGNARKKLIDCFSMTIANKMREISKINKNLKYNNERVDMLNSAIEIGDVLIETKRTNAKNEKAGNMDSDYDSRIQSLATCIEVGELLTTLKVRYIGHSHIVKVLKFNIGRTEILGEFIETGDCLVDLKKGYAGVSLITKKLKKSDELITNLPAKYNLCACGSCDTLGFVSGKGE